MEAIVILTNLPDQASAERLARRLVETKIAACVNILAPCVSIYRWQGAVETTQEVPVLIKTLRAHYHKLEQAVRECHPYTLPEIIALPVVAGLPDYLAWIAAATTNQEMGA
jgi:periplasmic divalent cation tolerance protein